MVTVEVKLISSELTPGLSGGEYTIEEGSTILDLLAQCQNVCGAVIPEENYPQMYPLFNGKPVKLDSEITKDGKLQICRIARGG